MDHPHHLPAVERQLFGGCVGSTCGGIKALRFLIMFKQSIQEMNQLAHPRALLSIKVGKSVVNELELLLSLRDDHGLFCLGA